MLIEIVWSFLHKTLATIYLNLQTMSFSYMFLLSLTAKIVCLQKVWPWLFQVSKVIKANFVLEF